jgi:hypothetical protein
MAPTFFDPHISTPSATFDLIGVELDWTCWQCGRQWRLEHYFVEGELLGAGLDPPLGPPTGRG